MSDTSNPGRWCNFCQAHHSSMSCFHPGRDYMRRELQTYTERFDKTLEKNRLDAWDKINKKSHKVTQLQEKLDAVAELAQSWLCSAQKPTSVEAAVDKCGMQLLEILGEEEIT